MSLIDVKNLTFSYDGSFDNVFENVSFQIDTDWKIGFTGRNGRGKSLLQQQHGNIRLGTSRRTKRVDASSVY